MSAERNYKSQDLTPKEIEVVRLAAEGYRNAEIAELLGIVVKTVEARFTRLAKLHSWPGQLLIVNEPRATMTSFALRYRTPV